MSGSLQLFLALLVAHLVGDFLVQRPAVVEGRRRGAPWAYAEHGGWHLATLIVVLALFASRALEKPSTVAVLVGLVAGHLVVDWSKSRHGQDLRPGLGFLMDQAAHALLITAAWALIVGPRAAGDEITAAWQGVAPHLLVLTAAYLLALPGAGYLNASLLARLAHEIGGHDDDGGETLANAGKRIGWLERFLILTAVMVRSPTGVGLVLAAKSVFRFEEARHGRRAAEYFLIGTFLSVSEAVLVGLGALRLLGR